MSKDTANRASPNKQEPVAQLFDDMAQQIAQLGGLWTIYKRLFFFDQATVDLLNASAPRFFALLQSWLEDEIIMAICRLLDPTQPPSWRNNLCVEAVIREAFASPCERQFLNRLADLRSQAQPLRRERNKRLAHADKAVRLTGKRTREGVTIGLVDKLVSDLLALRRDIYRQLKPDHDYQKDATTLAHHAEDLLACLERARHHGSTAQASISDPDVLMGPALSGTE